jgi:hypothetical protein
LGELRHETGYDAHDSTRIRPAVGDRPRSPFASLRPLLKPHERDAADGLRKLAARGGFDAWVRIIRSGHNYVTGPQIERARIDAGPCVFGCRGKS